MTVVINGTTGISTPGLSNSSTSTNTGNVTNSGTVTNASTISVGNATPSSSGAGITFPATQSASTDANTLDDYEEGTFTLTVTGSGGGAATYNSRSAAYVKVGRVVTVNFWVYGSGRNTLSGGITLTGLPFPASNVADYRPASFLRVVGMTITGQIEAWIPQNTTYLNTEVINNGSTVTLNATSVSTSTFEFDGSITYITD